MIPCDLCKRRLHNFIGGKSRRKLCHIFEIPDGISLHLRKGQLDVCGKVFDEPAAPDLVCIDDRTDGVVQLKQLAVYLNRRAVLRRSNLLLDLFDCFQIFVLVHQIESGLYQRQALAEKISNFELRLPSPQSELAIQTMKDPYIFDFIPFKTDMLEREIEEALVKDVTKLLLELGTGFAFLGNQYHLNVGGDDFYIDLLFYNLNLRCYVVIELKTGEFKPEYAGQLNFYLSAVDGILKKEQDNPSVGLLLCKSKNDLVAEYSLKDMSKPIGVSAYQVTSKLPEELEKQLPSVEDIQKRIK